MLQRESFSVPPIVTDTIVPAAGMAQSLCPVGAIRGTGADIYDTSKRGGVVRASGGQTTSRLGAAEGGSGAATGRRPRED